MVGFLLTVGLCQEAGSLPLIKAPVAVILDVSTGKYIYEKQADEFWTAASLTKIMTLFLVSEWIEKNDINVQQKIPINDHFWREYMTSGAALMLLEKGQQVTLAELMTGLVVTSGNDAAFLLASLVAPSIPDFVAKMNKEAMELELSALHFEDPSGLNPHNRITARQFASLCHIYIQKFPNNLSRYHQVRQMVYPQLRHQPLRAHASFVEPITRNNQNLLLGKYSGVDGLKTGYLSVSGYNLALTAEQNGRRLVVVLLGGPGKTHAEGRQINAADGAALLDWGFAHLPALPVKKLDTSSELDSATEAQSLTSPLSALSFDTQQIPDLPSDNFEKSLVQQFPESVMASPSVPVGDLRTTIDQSRPAVPKSPVVPTGMPDSIRASVDHR